MLPSILPDAGQCRHLAARGLFLKARGELTFATDEERSGSPASFRFHRDVQETRLVIRSSWRT